MTLTIRRSTVPFDRRMCAVFPCTAPAVDVLGARPACARCATEARAHIAESAERVPKFGVGREGDEKALAVMV